MKKLWMALSITLLVLGLIWFANGAFGGWSWAADPVFKLDGQTVQVRIEIAGEESLRSQITGDNPVVVVVQVPKGMEYDLLSTPGPIPMAVSFEEKGKSPELSVQVPDVDSFDGMRVTVKCQGEITDSDWITKRAVKLSFELP